MTTETTTTPSTNKGFEMKSVPVMESFGSTTPQSCFVQPGTPNSETPSCCVVYQPGDEPIKDGFTGTLQVQGGGSSEPIRLMNFEIWETLETPRVDKPGHPATRYANKFYSLDLKPGANYNIDANKWASIEAIHQAARNAIEMGFLKVLYPTKGWKGSADHSAAFSVQDALTFVRHVWSPEDLKQFVEEESRAKVKEAAQAQLRRIQGIEASASPAGSFVR